MKNEIMQFVREKPKTIRVFDPESREIAVMREKGAPRGILIAKKIGDQIQIGWSFVHKKLDNFDKKKGLLIAKNRLTSPCRNVDKIPHEVQKLLPDFIERAKNYFVFSSERDNHLSQVRDEDLDAGWHKKQ